MSSSTPRTKGYELTAKQSQARDLLGGSQTHTLLRGGSRSGKTFLLVRAVAIRAARFAGSRHAILRFRGNAVRASIWLDTLPKVMRLCLPEVRLTEHRQDGYVSLPNGAEIWMAGLDDKERVEKILGQEYATLYFNECSQIPYSSVLIAQTRLAQNMPGLLNRALYDCNPPGTGHWTYRLFKEKRDPETGRPIEDPSDYAEMLLNPGDNAANLPERYLKTLAGLPEKQRRRFLEGEWVPEVDGALWTFDVFERNRVSEADLPDMQRIVVAVDPSGAGGAEDKRSDEIGIVVAGKGVDGKGYVLADRTVRLGPAGWGRVAVQAYEHFRADCIVAEKNFGGAMVEHVIKTADQRVPVHLVSASRGKVVRAEPVSALYEQDEVRHVGRLPELEEQMVNMAASGYVGEKSPDRMDAAVWALTELMLGDGTYDTSMSWV
jgi:hypothetical protein